MTNFIGTRPVQTALLAAAAALTTPAQADEVLYNQTSVDTSVFWGWSNNTFIQPLDPVAQGGTFTSVQTNFRSIGAQWPLSNKVNLSISLRELNNDGTLGATIAAASPGWLGTVFDPTTGYREQPLGITLESTTGSLNLTSGEKTALVIVTDAGNMATASGATGTPTAYTYSAVFNEKNSFYNDFKIAATVTAISAVPEPAPAAMLAAGVVGLGFVARRRKQQAKQLAQNNAG